MLRAGAAEFIPTPVTHGNVQIAAHDHYQHWPFHYQSLMVLVVMILDIGPFVLLGKRAGVGVKIFDCGQTIHPLNYKINIYKY